MAKVTVTQGQVRLQTERGSSRQLLVDISVILRSNAHTGIQRVVRALLGALIDADLDGYVVRPIYATRRSEYAYTTENVLLLGEPKPDREPTDEPVTVSAGDIFLALDLAANVLPLRRAQLARWKQSGCRIAVVMYDLLPLQRPSWFNLKTRLNYRRWLRLVTKISDQIICISEEVANDLRGWISARPWRGNQHLRINWMRLGGDIVASSPTSGLPLNAAPLLAQFSKSRMLLVVGTIEPRKGHAILLPAFDKIWGKASGADPILVFVGRPGWKTTALQTRMNKHPELERRFFWFDNASDEFLEQLYEVARGVIIPSLAEGFGLPLIEAARHGKPVLARNLPVFRAMGLRNVTYFDEDHPSVLADTVEYWMDRSETSDLLVEQVPTWQNSLYDLLRCLSIQTRQ